MSTLPARRAVRSGRELANIRDVISACARLALFHSERIALSREDVERFSEVLFDFLAEVNDASPKV